MELDKKSIERKFPILLSSRISFCLHLARYKTSTKTHRAGEEKSTLDLPRWKRTVGVSLIDAKSDEVSLAKGKHDNVIATVDLWRLGIGYNINRMLGNSQQLYVITR